MACIAVPLLAIEGRELSLFKTKDAKDFSFFVQINEELDM